LPPPLDSSPPDASQPDEGPSPTASDPSDEGAILPPLTPWALRAPPSAPEPLERILRGLLLSPLLVGGFHLGVTALSEDSDLVWYLFAGQLALLAVPVAYVESALHARGVKLRAAASCLLLLAITAAAWLLIGQTFYAQGVVAGIDQASALRSSVLVLTKVSLQDAAAYLLPLGLPFTASLLLNLQGVRWRWQSLLLLLCVPPAMILMAAVGGGGGPALKFDLTIVFMSALLIPLANAGAASLARRWRQRSA